MIVGDGPLRQELETLAAALGLGDAVEFAGQRVDVSSILGRSRVFVLTSKTEGLSLALMEAMMAGLPAVVSDVGDLGDLVRHGENGYLVDVQTPDRFAERIAAILKDRRDAGTVRGSGAVGDGEARDPMRCQAMGCDPRLLAGRTGRAMCGITGYAGLNDPALLRKMCGVLVHRGPDEDGFYSGDAIGLAMRRLAVIDLKTGSQPIANEKRNVWVVFNGEIYNFEELRKTLEGSGHTFATNSDTETIVHLYEDHGLDFVRYLQGMFAIALWDERRERLLLVRDRIGEKPLYYAFDEGKLFFGSEIKAILQAGMRRSVDAQSVCDFLAAGYVAGERTFFKGISKIPPGNIGVYEKGEFTVRPYWESRNPA